MIFGFPSQVNDSSWVSETVVIASYGEPNLHQELQGNIVVQQSQEVNLYVTDKNTFQARVVLESPSHVWSVDNNQTTADGSSHDFEE